MTKTTEDSTSEASSSGKEVKQQESGGMKREMGLLAGKIRKFLNEKHKIRYIF